MSAEPLRAALAHLRETWRAYRHPTLHDYGIESRETCNAIERGKRMCADDLDAVLRSAEKLTVITGSALSASIESADSPAGSAQRPVEPVDVVMTGTRTGTREEFVQSADELTSLDVDRLQEQERLVRLGEMLEGLTFWPSPNADQNLARDAGRLLQGKESTHSNLSEIFRLWGGPVRAHKGECKWNRQSRN